MKKILSGKVREIYEVSEKELVMVTTDRISAFDVILPSAIPDKGIALNLLSLYWFDYTASLFPNHILSSRLSDMPACFSENFAQYEKRTVLVKKLRMLPYEFIVRGYLFGSLWEEYKASGCLCGQKTQHSYQLAEKLAEPMIPPAAKSKEGHDTYISVGKLRREMGKEEADKICRICLELYQKCCARALQGGVLIADTKFEFGYDENGRLTLADEIFTPDSSRFWPLSGWQAGMPPRSYDKQFVRDWLIQHKLNGVTPPPVLPEELIRKTAELYKRMLHENNGKRRV